MNLPLKAGAPAAPVAVLAAGAALPLSKMLALSWAPVAGRQTSALFARVPAPPPGGHPGQALLER